jgi:hypothetical protein
MHGMTDSTDLYPSLFPVRWEAASIAQASYSRPVSLRSVLLQRDYWVWGLGRGTCISFQRDEAGTPAQFLLPRASMRPADMQCRVDPAG